MGGTKGGLPSAESLCLLGWGQTGRLGADGRTPRDRTGGAAETENVVLSPEHCVGSGHRRGASGGSEAVAGQGLEG